MGPRPELVDAGERVAGWVFCFGVGGPECALDRKLAWAAHSRQRSTRLCFQACLFHVILAGGPLHPRIKEKSRWRFCASLRSRLFANIYPKNAGGQTAYPEFTRACAVEMHMDITQSRCYAKITGKFAAPQDQENVAVEGLREPVQSKCGWTSHKSNFIRELTAKMPQNTLSWCEPSHSKPTWRSQGDVSRSTEYCVGREN